MVSRDTKVKGPPNTLFDVIMYWLKLLYQVVVTKKRRYSMQCLIDAHIRRWHCQRDGLLIVVLLINVIFSVHIMVFNDQLLLVCSVNFLCI